MLEMVENSIVSQPLMWESEDCCPVSLHELMYKLNVGDIALQMSMLESLRKAATTLDGRQAGSVVPESAVAILSETLSKVQAIQDSLQLDHSLKNQLFMLATQLQRGSADLRANAVAVAVEQILGGLAANLRTRTFLFVPESKARHYRNLDSFGIAPYVFLEAAPDMLDAGDCYAADLSTACIFHLMRVSEYGLRALARKLRVSLRDKGKKCPIEYVTWNKVLEAIDTKINTIRLKPLGQAKNDDLTFYSDAASHCRHIRDIWRNEVSHTRTRYSEHEAFAAMNRIADFMQLLAEGLYTPMERERIISRHESSRLPVNQSQSRITVTIAAPKQRT